MKKDTTSFEAHDHDYKHYYSKEDTFAIYEEYRKKDAFGTAGFRKALDLFQYRDLHIDIGCGSGWLLTNTAPLFKNIIGIEPSATAIEVAKGVTKSFPNVSYVNKDMIDGIKGLEITTPAFFTSAVVFSHIKDFYVAAFLKELNIMTNGSTLFFDERYDKNMQQKLWHIRNRKWWAAQLPEWQLVFFALDNNGYKSGIFGTRVGSDKVTNRYQMTAQEKVKWIAEGITLKTLRIGRGIKKILRLS